MIRKLWVIPFLLFGGSLFAQEFRAGLMGGINGSQLDGDGLGGYHKAGLYTGLYVSRDITDKVYWQLELAYSGKGSQRVVTAETLDEGPWLRLNLHYIDIPFTVHYRYKDSWGFHGGVGLNFLVNYSFRDPRLFEINKAFKVWEPALILGTTYQLRSDLWAYARFSYSILSIDPRGPYVPFFALLQAGQFNNVLSVGMRYQLRG
ncbi:MAG: outer membrane beta-barrel protein [Bacteroidia bacterium]